MHGITLIIVCVVGVIAMGAVGYWTLNAIGFGPEHDPSARDADDDED